MSWAGGACGDSGKSDRLTPVPYFQNTGIAPAWNDGGVHSRGGFEYEGADGGPSVDMWPSTAAGNNWYYIAFEDSVISGESGDTWASIMFHHSGSDNTGAVRLRIDWQSSTTFSFELEYYDGSAWVASGASASYNVGTVYYVRVRIDTTPTTGRSMDLVVNDGITECGLASTVDLLATTPSCHNSATKGDGALTWRWWELFRNDTTADPTPSTAQTYTSANSDVHCYGGVPRRDVSGSSTFAPDSDWHTVGGKHSERFRWAQVDDAYDDSWRTDDYMTMTGDSADHDWMFRFNQYVGSEGVQAVGISQFTDVGLDPTADKVIARVPSDSTTVTELATSITAGFGWNYAFMPGLPVNPTTEWTKAYFNEMEAGPRVSNAIAAGEYRVNGVIAHVIGTNLSQPDKSLGNTPPPSSPALSSDSPMII